MKNMIQLEQHSLLSDPTCDTAPAQNKLSHEGADLHFKEYHQYPALIESPKPEPSGRGRILK
jgi:hypothetical protein